MRGVGSQDEEAGGALPIALLLDRAKSILGAGKQFSGLREVLDETWTPQLVLPRPLTYLGYGVSAHRFSVRGEPVTALIKGFEELAPRQVPFLNKVSNLLDGLQDGYFEVGDRHCFLQVSRSGDRCTTASWSDPCLLAVARQRDVGTSRRHQGFL